MQGIFNIGQPIKVRVTEVDAEGSRIIASILKASQPSPTVELKKLEMGQAVTGTLVEIHKENIVLELQPNKVKALLSLANLANHSSIPVNSIKDTLKIGQEVAELVVVSKNAEKGLVIVAKKPTAKAKVPSSSIRGSGTLRMEDIKVGMTLPGLVIENTIKGVTVRLSKHVFGTLHPTDACDDFGKGQPFPAIDSVVNTVVVEVDERERKVVLSARGSTLNPPTAESAVDKEIKTLDDLKVGDRLRGFIKTVTEHGLFVTIGRGIDARVQIKELFDEVSTHS